MARPGKLTFETNQPVADLVAAFPVRCAVAKKGRELKALLLAVEAQSSGAACTCIYRACSAGTVAAGFSEVL